MSASAWEMVSNFMVHGVIGVDLLIGVMVAAAVGVCFVGLGALALRGFKYFAGQGSSLKVDDAGGTFELVDRFDDMARITISRRPRTRKRRHRPQPHSSAVSRRS